MDMCLGTREQGHSFRGLEQADFVNRSHFFDISPHVQ